MKGCWMKKLLYCEVPGKNHLGIILILGSNYSNVYCLFKKPRTLFLKLLSYDSGYRAKCRESVYG